MEFWAISGFLVVCLDFKGSRLLKLLANPFAIGYSFNIKNLIIFVLFSLMNKTRFCVGPLCFGHCDYLKEKACVTK